MIISSFGKQSFAVWAIINRPSKRSVTKPCGNLKAGFARRLRAGREADGLGSLWEGAVIAACGDD